MSDVGRGRLTLLDVPNGADREGLVDFLVKSLKNVSRERVTEIMGTLPLVLSWDISELKARRITAHMEKLGAKLCFSLNAPKNSENMHLHNPGSTQESPRSRLLTEVLLNEAFSGEKIFFPVSFPYKVGLMLVSLAMVLLPVAYCAIIGGVGYFLYWHATANFHVFHTSRRLKDALVIYLGPLIIGGIVILFLVKPLFARRAEQSFPYKVLPRDEPLLFAFLEKICATIGVPMPCSVRLDNQVNASAGFARGIRSFRGNDLELTIGLPLVLGLTVAEFAGVLAHEFGHFAQSSGMRLSYLVRSINNWFARVVYEEDVYDARLRTISQTASIQLGVFMWMIRFLT